jgi:hypothetical protein
MVSKSMTKTYTHELNKEIRSISGTYELHEEKRLTIDGRDILYAVGNAMVDSSCCGVWGCRFVVVPGYIVRFKYRTDSAQQPVSVVEPISDGAVRKKIIEQLNKEEGVTQVRFW